MDTVPIPAFPQNGEDLQHPTWCAAQSCTAPDRLAERGVDEATVPMSRRSSHFGEPHTIPTSRISEVQLTLELTRDVYVEVTNEPDGVLLSYASELCGHAGTLTLTGEQMGPLSTAAASMRDTFRTDRNPVLDEVAQALRVLGCVTWANADALLSLCVVHLTRQERESVLAQFPGQGLEVAELPTAEQLLREADAKLSEAYAALGDAGDWLRSDWSPVGTTLTGEQANRRSAMRQAITAAKDAINGGRS